MIELIELLVFQPLFGFLHATVMFLHPSATPEARSAKTTIGVLFAVAAMGVLILLISLWLRAPWWIPLPAGVAAVVSGYTAGFVASRYEEKLKQTRADT